MTLFPFFFFNDTATTEIYTLSLHDALPISSSGLNGSTATRTPRLAVPLWTLSEGGRQERAATREPWRSEEHTSELQSHLNLVCRLLLEKKKQCKGVRERSEPLYDA